MRVASCAAGLVVCHLSGSYHLHPPQSLQVYRQLRPPISSVMLCRVVCCALFTAAVWNNVRDYLSINTGAGIQAFTASAASLILQSHFHRDLFKNNAFIE
jgi:hypothetical protein